MERPLEINSLWGVPVTQNSRESITYLRSDPGAVLCCSAAGAAPPGRTELPSESQ